MRPVDAGEPLDPAGLTVPGVFRSITPMFAPTIPRVLHRGRWWSADELDAIARRWRAAALEVVRGTSRLVATAVPAAPEGVALIVALSSLPSPLVVLLPDPRAWETDPPLPAGTLLLLPPSLASLGAAAREAGLEPHLLPEPDAGRVPAPPIVPFEGPGVVVFTSGSTGLPKPVFRHMPALIAWGMARVGALGLTRGAGTLMGVSLASGQGIHTLVSSIVLGGSLGLLDPLDHRTALAALASPVFQCWRATAHFADALGRCPIEGPARAPEFCLVSSPIPRAVHDRFLDRFGVPLRQTYSCTEAGVVSLDDASPAAVRPDTVGRPLDGVDVLIGDHPGAPLPRGETGRIWVRTPWAMTGYGFPPSVAPPATTDGWWPTQDVGTLEADGHLTLGGRLDDCIRTREGRLVNLAVVAARLRDLPGVTAAVAVPLVGTAGPSFGAVVECEPGVTAQALRTGLGHVLPPWSWPRAMETVRELPRLASGRPDRRSCVALLGGAVTA
jgi:acyl-CoA synthetase (AMP-forming)/AMP-acid ligase II